MQRARSLLRRDSMSRRENKRERKSKRGKSISWCLSFSFCSLLIVFPLLYLCLFFTSLSLPSLSPYFHLWITSSNTHSLYFLLISFPFLSSSFLSTYLYHSFCHFLHITFCHFLYCFSHLFSHSFSLFFHTSHSIYSSLFLVMQFASPDLPLCT